MLQRLNVDLSFFCFLGLPRSDDAYFLHGIQDKLLSLFGKFPVFMGGVGRGGGEDADEEGGFGEGQDGGVFVEVSLAGFLDAVGTGAEVDGVEVEGEYFFFVVGMLKLESEDYFFGFAAPVLLLSEEDIFCELLGNSGGTFFDATFLDVDKAGSDDAFPIDADVVVEAAVFHDDDCLLEGRGNILKGSELFLFDVVGDGFFEVE